MYIQQLVGSGTWYLYNIYIYYINTYISYISFAGIYRSTRWIYFDFSPHPLSIHSLEPWVDEAPLRFQVTAEVAPELLDKLGMSQSPLLIGPSPFNVSNKVPILFQYCQIVCWFELFWFIFDTWYRLFSLFACCFSVSAEGWKLPTALCQRRSPALRRQQLLDCQRSTTAGHDLTRSRHHSIFIGLSSLRLERSQVLVIHAFPPSHVNLAGRRYPHGGLCTSVAGAIQCCQGAMQWCSAGGVALTVLMLRTKSRNQRTCLLDLYRNSDFGLPRCSFFLCFFFLLVLER